MARPRSQDYIQNFRFQVRETTATFFKSTAGFKSVTVPDVSSPVVEYRDGLTIFTFKQPGIPTVGNLMMTQGTTTNQSEFNKWISAALEGDDYRTDLNVEVLDNAKTANVVKRMECYEVLPIRNKVFADLEATSGDINIREVEAATEQITESL